MPDGLSPGEIARLTKEAIAWVHEQRNRFRFIAQPVPSGFFATATPLFSQVILAKAQLVGVDAMPLPPFHALARF